MMTVLALLTGIFLVALVVLLVELRHVPEAYEDQTGFHLARQKSQAKPSPLFRMDPLPDGVRPSGFGN